MDGNGKFINNDPQNTNQEAYYNNNSYYSNGNYGNYSEARHEEKKKGNGTWWKVLLVIIILVIIILLLLKFCVGDTKSKDAKFEELRVRICNAATKYIASNPSILDSESVGRSAIIKFKTLSDTNLIEAQVANPYYDGNLFKKGTVEKYYSSNTSVRLTMQGDGTPFCEIVDNSQDVTAPELRLSGDSEISLAVGTAFEDPGYMATDDYDGDITDRVVRSGNVDLSKAGTYTLTYSIQDSGGKTVNKTRTVTVKAPVDGNPSVRFTEDKSNVTVEVGKGNNTLIKAPKAVNENGVAVSVSTAIEDYNTKKAVSAIDWNKVGKYRITYTAIHGNGTVKQTKTQIVTIENSAMTIGGKNTIDVSLRTSNCDLNEADLVKGGVTFSGNGVVTLANNSGKACTTGKYVVPVTATTEDGKKTTKDITVNVVNNGKSNTSTSKAPSKTTITSNSANTSNVYNTDQKWVGGATTGIQISLQATPASGTELSYFEYSVNCTTASDGKISVTSKNKGTLLWKEEGKNKICIRAVTKDGIGGLWSDPVYLYLDLTGPKAEFTHTWADGYKDWHNTSTLTITYKATDSGSGLKNFEYTYDDVKAKKAENITTYNEATGKLTVSNNTEPSKIHLYVYVRAVDNAGNKGEWTLKPAYANIDTVKPNAPELRILNNNSKNPAVMPYVADAATTNTRGTSGIGKFVYTLDGGKEQEIAAIDTCMSMNKAKEFFGKDNNASGGTEMIAITGLCFNGANAPGQTAIDDTNRNDAYYAQIGVPANTTSADKKYSVKVWSVDRAGNKSASATTKTVTVKPGIKATEITMKNGSTAITSGKDCGSGLKVGGTLKLTYAIKPVNSDEKTVTWTSSDTSVVTVSNGTITAKKVGSATITAKVGSVSTKCKVTVLGSIICPAGQYLPKGKSACAKCPAGSSCAGGTYVTSTTKDQGITVCAKGSYSGAGASKCTACASGKTTSGTGSTSASACTDTCKVYCTGSGSCSKTKPTTENTAFAVFTCNATTGKTGTMQECWVKNSYAGDSSGYLQCDSTGRSWHWMCTSGELANCYNWGGLQTCCSKKAGHCGNVQAGTMSTTATYKCSC